MRNRVFFGFIVLFSVLVSVYIIKGNQLHYFKIAGFTQGTTYHITYSSKDSVDLQKDVDLLLAKFDSSLSTYVDYSIISRINNNDLKVTPDSLFLEVYRKAKEVYLQTDGAFDITVAPLVKLWGFGKNAENTHPDDSLIDSILNLVGMSKISLDSKHNIIKQDPRITLDVNAIAQGYAVDYICNFLDDSGIQNYMVEIGGELKTKGKNPKGDTWKIGIDKPSEDNTVFNRQLQAIVKLDNKALATSGNYRKFYEDNGTKYVHTIDPKSGYTVKSNLLSVTVLADDCMTADAYATAAMVMGLERSKSLFSLLDNLDAFLIYSDQYGNYLEWYTDGFNKLIVK